MKSNFNSATYWLPRMEHAIRQPKTVFVDYDHRAVLGLMCEEPAKADVESLEAIVAKVKEALVVVGVPAFLRTDQSSAKHAGPIAYKIERADEDVIRRVILATAEDNEMKFMCGPAPTKLLVRQWLDLDAHFTAFGGHPIAREWRFFASREGAECWHFYWPKSAVKGSAKPGAALEVGWESAYEAISEPLHPFDCTGLGHLAKLAAFLCHDEQAKRWSVDFAKDKTGRWWLIDMAVAEDSWHPGTCPTSNYQEDEDEDQNALASKLLAPSNGTEPS